MFNDASHSLKRLFKERIAARLKEEYIRSWLSEQPKCNIEEYYRQLLPIFLNTDISVTSESVIPSNYGQQPVSTFPPGEYQSSGVVLQIQDTMDISHSTLSSLNHLNNTTTVRRRYVQRDTEEVEFTRGMLRWSLTDGAHNIQAMEMETIPELNLKTPFGCKLLIKNCQIRRGMLLLNKKSVRILGGDVPSLYGGNMITELETRFKAKLNMTSTLQSTTTPPTPSPHTHIAQTSQRPANISTPSFNREPVHEIVDEIEEFDDDFDEAILAMEEADQLELNNHSSMNNQVNNAILSDDDSIPDFDDDSAIFQQLPIIEQTRSTTTKSISLSKRKNMDESGSTSSMRTVSRNIDNKRPRASNLSEEKSEIMSTQALQELLPFVHPSHWNNSYDDTIVLDSEESKNIYISFNKLRNTLDAMKNNRSFESTADIVIVRAICKSLASMKLLKCGFYMLGYIQNSDDPDDEPIAVVFRSKIVPILLDGMTFKDLIDIGEKEGFNTLAQKVFKPLQDRLLSKIADIHLDLSLVEKGPNASLMPMVVDYIFI